MQFDRREYIDGFNRYSATRRNCALLFFRRRLVIGINQMLVTKSRDRSSPFVEFVTAKFPSMGISM